MDNPQTVDTNGAVGQQTAGAPAPSGNQPDYKALYENTLAQFQSAQAESREWKTRFDGMKGKYDQELGKWKETTNQLGTLSTERESLSLKVEELSKQLNSVQTEFGEVSQTRTSLQRENERLQTVLEKFPHLGEFLDFVPKDKTGDELTEALQSLSSKIANKRKDELSKDMSGAVPPVPPAQGATGTPEEVLRLATKAMAENQIAEYNKYMNDYYALLSQQE